MISICIPVYNFDVTELVEMLLEQSTTIHEEVEILVFDDRSNSFYKKRNSLLTKYDTVSYLEFETNLGRSRIRNRLADFSVGSHLLFLDCDMIPSDCNFLRNYVEAKELVPVICGGIAYGDKPFQQELLLRWKYGVAREAYNETYRQYKPYRLFTNGNFMVSKEVFNQIRYNEDIMGYGHENTLFALELKNRKIPILHIHNPSLHLGIEPNYEFLAKSEQGIVSLVRLLTIAPNMRKELFSNIRILRFYQILRILGLKYPIRWFFRVFNPMIRRALCSAKPSLLLFDLYKVGLIARIYHRI
jgi:glycosyltransferase involved in cell wall biosynthesis